jgi:hypothetical protein
MNLCSVQGWMCSFGSMEWICAEYKAECVPLEVWNEFVLSTRPNVFLWKYGMNLCWVQGRMCSFGSMEWICAEYKAECVPLQVWNEFVLSTRPNVFFFFLEVWNEFVLSTRTNVFFRSVKWNRAKYNDENVSWGKRNSFGLNKRTGRNAYLGNWRINLYSVRTGTYVFGHAVWTVLFTFSYRRYQCLRLYSVELYDQWIINWKGMGGKWSWLNMRYPGILHFRVTEIRSVLRALV